MTGVERSPRIIGPASIARRKEAIVNRRQELVAVIEGGYAGDDSDCPYEHGPAIADAVLAYLARPVELKPADLEALGDRAALADHEGDLWQKRGGVWCGYEVSDHTSTRLARFGPFRILDTGKA